MLHSHAVLPFFFMCLSFCTLLSFFVVSNEGINTFICAVS